jgi:hypothetical protein
MNSLRYSFLQELHSCEHVTPIYGLPWAFILIGGSHRNVTPIYGLPWAFILIGGSHRNVTPIYGLPWECILIGDSHRNVTLNEEIILNILFIEIGKCVLLSRIIYTI